MPRLNKQNPLPLYQQLAQILRDQIRQGVYSVGDRLPTERELMESNNISRNTVRQALDQLERETLLQRDQGRGTFVSSQKLKLGVMRLTSFTEDMRERNMLPSSRTIARRTEPPPSEISNLLNLLPGENAFFLERLRYADGIPMAINRSYFNLVHLPALAEDYLDNGSIYTIIENKYHLSLVYASQTISAEPATNDEADLLGVSIHFPLLVVEGLVFSQDEKPVEYLRSAYRSDRYEFSVEALRSI